MNAATAKLAVLVLIALAAVLSSWYGFLILMIPFVIIIRYWKTYDPTGVEHAFVPNK